MVYIGRGIGCYYYRAEMKAGPVLIGTRVLYKSRVPAGNCVSLCNFRQMQRLRVPLEGFRFVWPIQVRDITSLSSAHGSCKVELMILVRMYRIFILEVGSICNDLR